MILIHFSQENAVFFAPVELRCFCQTHTKPNASNKCFFFLVLFSMPVNTGI